MNLCFKKFLWQEQRAGTVLSYQNISLGFRRMFLKNQSHCDYPGAHYWLLGWPISPNFPPSLLCLYDTAGSAKKDAGKSTVFWVVWLSGWRGRLGSNVLGLTGLPRYICAVFEAVESWWLTTLEVQEKVLNCESRSRLPIFAAAFTVILPNASCKASEAAEVLTAPALGWQRGPQPAQQIQVSRHEHHTDSGNWV